MRRQGAVNFAEVSGDAAAVTAVLAADATPLSARTRAAAQLAKLAAGAEAVFALAPARVHIQG